MLKLTLSMKEIVTDIKCMDKASYLNNIISLVNNAIFIKYSSLFSDDTLPA